MVAAGSQKILAQLKEAVSLLHIVLIKHCDCLLIGVQRGCVSNEEAEGDQRPGLQVAHTLQV